MPPLDAKIEKQTPDAYTAYIKQLLAPADDGTSSPLEENFEPAVEAQHKLGTWIAQQLGLNYREDSKAISEAVLALQIGWRNLQPITEQGQFIDQSMFCRHNGKFLQQVLPEADLRRLLAFFKDVYEERTCVGRSYRYFNDALSNKLYHRRLSEINNGRSSDHSSVRVQLSTFPPEIREALVILERSPLWYTNAFTTSAEEVLKEVREVNSKSEDVEGMQVYAMLSIGQKQEFLSLLEKYAEQETIATTITRELLTFFDEKIRDLYAISTLATQREILESISFLLFFCTNLSRQGAGSVHYRKILRRLDEGTDELSEFLFSTLVFLAAGGGVQDSQSLLSDSDKGVMLLFHQVPRRKRLKFLNVMAEFGRNSIGKYKWPADSANHMAKDNPYDFIECDVPFTNWEALYEKYSSDPLRLLAAINVIVPDLSYGYVAVALLYSLYGQRPEVNDLEVDRYREYFGHNRALAPYVLQGLKSKVATDPANKHLEGKSATDSESNTLGIADVLRKLRIELGMLKFFVPDSVDHEDQLNNIVSAFAPQIREKITNKKSSKDVLQYLIEMDEVGWMKRQVIGLVLSIVYTEGEGEQSLCDRDCLKQVFTTPEQRRFLLEVIAPTLRVDRALKEVTGPRSEYRSSDIPPKYDNLALALLRSLTVSKNQQNRR